MSTNVAGVTSHFPDAENGFTTTTAGSVSSGAATVTLNSVGGYTNGMPVVLVIDPSDASKKQTFTGIVDTAGTQITDVVWTAGTNQSHSLGATVVDYETATHWAMVSKGILVEHNQDGTHSDITADSLTINSGGSVDFSEAPLAATDLANAAVTPDKLALGQQTDITGSGSTSSTSYVDLSTSCTATVTVPASGVVLALVSGYATNDGTASYCYTQLNVTGANTTTAPISLQRLSTNLRGNISGHYLFTGLTPGATVFTVQVKVDADTGTWGNVRLTLIPLGS